MSTLLHFAFLLTVLAATGRAQSIVTVATFSPFDSVSIIQGSDGNFYGIANSGGDGMCQGGCGLVFEVTPGGTMSTLYSFQPGPSGYPPLPNSLIQGADGNFYGTTRAAGIAGASCINGCGTIFKVTPGGSETALYAFDQTHGSSPVGNLVEGTDGNFYGLWTCPHF